jgi:hypothetical protein
MTKGIPDEVNSSARANEITRRQFMVRSGVWAALAAVATRSVAEQVAAQEASPVAIDPTELQKLLDLSKTLCGGGNFDPDRGSILFELIANDTDLLLGLDELFSTPPVEGQPLGSARAQNTAQTILVYWYAGVFKGEPVSNRSTAFYQLTSWQAMYTLPWAVCKDFGGWADAPRVDPLVASN